MTKQIVALLSVIMVSTVSVAMAQDTTAPLKGTITFRNGQTLSGIIKTADLGIMDGTGVGTDLSDNGSIKILVNGQSQRVPASNISEVDVTWANQSTPDETKWEITQLKITTRDGKTLVGKPDWYMHATNVSVQLPSGEVKRVHAFPLAGPDFSAGNLIAKIQLGAAAAATAPTTTPATTTPAAPGGAPAPTATTQTKPAAGTPAATGTAPATQPQPAAQTKPVATTPAPAPAPTTAPVAGTATPATTSPAAPTTKPAATAPAAAAPAGPAAATAAPATSSAGVAVTAKPSGTPVAITVDIPGTGKKVLIVLYVSIVNGQVQVTPATGATSAP